MSLRSCEVWAWISAFVGYLSLLTVLFVRQRSRVFPWFTALIGFQTAEVVGLYFVHRVSSSTLYAYTYWGLEIVESLIRIGVMIELARITACLLGEGDKKRIDSMLYCLGIAAFGTIAIVVSHHGFNDLLISVSIKTSLCTSILGAFMAICFVAMTFFEGLRVRLHSQSVAYGMFFYFSGRLLIEIKLLYGDVASWHRLHDFLKPVYIICLFAWCVAFWFDEPSRVLSSEMDRLRGRLRALEQFQRSQHESIGSYQL
jgi:hypothetical protein